MKRIYSIALLALLLTGATLEGGAHSIARSTAPSAALTALAETTREVKVYLVAVGDEGRTGKKIGCGDSLVPVTRKVKASGAPLKAAILELLAIPREYAGDSRLNNFWVGKNLRVKSISIRAGLATINLVGEGPFVAGICDEPRITSQIEETARQFPAVKRVKVFVNGSRLADVIR